jgi:hypothetical protein
MTVGLGAERSVRRNREPVTTISSIAETAESSCAIAGEWPTTGKKTVTANPHIRLLRNLFNSRVLITVSPEIDLMPKWRTPCIPLAFKLQQEFY